ncbi:redoxin domain-containing protein [Puteibacter caeruleilacunae]|nr:redoxin domain-containing protein [Puteibacter caeruleilacunae]
MEPIDMCRKGIITMILVVLFTGLYAQETTNEKAQSLKIVETPDSFAELLKSFKGKVLYIDIMASFCKPCISELKTSEEMDKFFEEKDIQRLFISLDNPKDITKCKKILEDNNVKGYFVSMHSENKKSEFGGDILKLFFTDKDGKIGLSIPRYAIVDKTGKLAVSKAARPSNMEGLKKQLNQYK